MKTMIISSSPNKIGLTNSCVDICIKTLQDLNVQTKWIVLNQYNIKKCEACGKRGWGICLDKHICIQNDDFNEIYKHMGDFDVYVFITPVYFHEMSESAKTFFDRLKRCDAFNDESKIKGKKIVCIACAGGSGSGTEETLKAFDTLNYFLGTKMYARIPVTKANFEKQRKVIENAMKLEDN